MEIKLVTATNLDKANSFALKLLKNRDKNFNTIIITPDRMTLNVEEQLFFELQENCFFDINVTTLTRLSNTIISNSGLNKNVLTKAMAVAVIRKILEDEQANLKIFKKSISYSGFAEKIFDIISMFKSCNVSPEQINTNFNNETLKNKLNEIKLIYEKYENYLQNDFTDSFNKLNLFKNLITKENFAKTNIYFIGFDDFTKQAYDIIAKFFKCANSCVVACSKCKINKPNKNIYLNNVYDNIKSLAFESGLYVDEIECDSVNVGSKLFLEENLFAVKPQQYKGNKTNNINFISFENIKNECEYVAKKIIDMVVKQNYTYSDFTIALSNFNGYESVMEETFLKANVPVFFDRSKTLDSMLPVRFMQDVFKCIAGGLKTTDVLNVLKSSLITLKEEDINDFEDLLLKYNIKFLNNLSFVKTIVKDNPCLGFIENLIVLQNNVKSENFENLFKSYNEFLVNIGYDLAFGNLIKKLNELNKIVELKELIQAQQKFVNSSASLIKIMGDSCFSTKQFVEISKAFFGQINITVPPIMDNSVFIGSVQDSYFKENKVLFVLGCSEGAFPQYKNDLGLISDSEINILNKNINLSPTINFINKKNKFKAFEVALKFSDSLFFTYSKVDNDGGAMDASTAIKNLYCALNSKPVFVPQKGESFLDVLYNCNAENLEFNVSSNKFSEDVLLNYLYQYDIILNNKTLFENMGRIINVNEELNNTVINNALKNYNENNVKENIKENKEVCFNSNKISVTQFETFFKCPYKYFVDYCVKIKEKDYGEVSALDYGNILHEYMYLLVPKIMEQLKNNANVSIDELNEISKNVLDVVLKNDKYIKFVTNTANYNLIKGLYSEAKRIAYSLYFEQIHSKFKPIYREKKFKLENAIYLKSLKKYVAIEGVIDRVDEYDSKFRIIDYKTGEDSFKNFNDIASGKKLQLIVYAKAFENESKMQPVGALYLPLKNKFSKFEEENLFQMQGVLTNDIQTLLCMDDNLINSDYSSFSLPVKTDKNGNLSSYSQDLRLSEQDFEYLENYVFNKIKEAVNEIENGSIQPTPLKENKKTVCDYCSYLGMCKFSQLKGNSYKVAGKVATINDLKKEENNE